MASGTFYPAVSGDDGYVLATSFMFTGADFLEIGNKGNYPDNAGFILFKNVAIPQGITITLAKVTFTAYGDDSGATNVNCHFEDADEGVAPTDAADYQGKSLTNVVAWDSVAAWTDGGTYDSPSLIIPLQAIVNRVGFVSGNDVLFSVENNGTVYPNGRRPSAIDYLSGAEKAELYVEWEEGETVILPAPLAATASLAATIEPGWDEIICPSPLLAETSLQCNLLIFLSPASFAATGELTGVPGISLSAGALSAIGAILGTPVPPFEITGTNRIYLFTLTGAADGLDDIVIPISSFQSRIRSGDPTYLSVVIPGVEFVDAINARLNGDLIIRMGYMDSGEILLTETVARVEFENIRLDEGATNKSITLDGHKTESWAAKEVDLENASYKALTGGKLRYRCKPDLYLRPGDTANINGDTFVVGSITYSVTPGQELYEVAE